MKNQYLLLSIACTFLLTSCAFMTDNEPPEPYNPTFQNNLPSQPVANKAEEDIIIALVKPSYALEDSYRPQRGSVTFGPTYYKYQLKQSSIGSQFQQSMANDFEETLNKKGFLLQGPYDSYDKMVYSDRKNSDLLLEAKIDVYPQIMDLNTKSVAYTDGYMIYESSAKIGGQLTLTIFEPMTETKLWTRSIPVPDTTFSFNGMAIYPAPPRGVNFENEIVFKNKMAKGLESFYSNLFQTTWDYLDPREMQQLKEQGIEIKKKSGFDAQQ